MRRFICFAILMLLAGCSQERGFDLDRLLKERPDADQMVFDDTGLMGDVRPSVEKHLKSIRDRYKIEILVVLVPTIGNSRTISEAAVELFSNWGIGKQVGGRGLLMFLVDDAKSVKIEVGYELEDVFTDLFTGYIQDVQLQPNFAAGRLDIGMIAMLEEIEARSQLKYQGRYNSATVASLDARYLSQGGGARHELETNEEPVFESNAVNLDYPAGNTPDEAWQTIIRHWKDKVRDPNLGVYTAVTRLTYRDYIQLPDARFEEDYRNYVNRPYEVRQDGDYAVIYFGKKKGWENSPFFFCRTAEGWQFDIVHQRRFVRMGTAPQWGIEFSEHPYMGMLMDSFYFYGQDIPLTGNDLYTIARDAELAARLPVLESRYHSDRNNAEAALELGRAYTIVSMSRKAISLLKSAVKRLPEDARPYKYIAIAYVNAVYQYDSALKALDSYIKLAPDDAFGYQFRGYIYYQKKDYAKAVADLEKALKIDPYSCYAHFYLTYAYAGRYQKAKAMNPRRNHYRKRFRYHRDQTRRFKQRHPIRVAWLNRSYPN